MSRSIRKRKERARQRAARRRIIALIALLLLLASTAGGAYAAYDYLKGPDEWPTITKLEPQRVGENSKVYAADGSLMGFIQSDQNRTKLGYSAMGEWAPQATIAIEDRRFYQHEGVDYEAVARAFVVNTESGETKEGASTITQQVIRNLYKEITTEKSLSRKAKEATLAVQFEDKFSKEYILTQYLNLVFYGNNAYGIQAAAQTYYSKPAAKLTLQEAAMLAGLPQAPSDYDPFANPEVATARRNDVLQSMLAEKMINKAQFDRASNSPLKLKAGRIYKDRKLPYFFDFVEKDLVKRFGADAVRQGGLNIKTTINPAMQRDAEQAIRSVLTDPNGPSGAIAVIDTKTGQIRAMASSESYEKSKFNRAAQAKRQPGSTAKTWVLAAALKEGINPDSTTYSSRPFKVRPVGSTEYWEPKTYSNSYRGTMTIRSATIASDNSVFAQMALDLGPTKIAKTARQLGISSKLEEYYSIALGSQVVTPLEQTNFYSTIARGGIRIDPRAVTQVKSASGATKPIKYAKGRRVLEDWQSEKIVDILHDNVLGGTGTAANILGEDISGKTGTTDDSKDAWFCGMTPELTACVWIGYNTPTPMYGETGGGRPAQIWRRFMESALDRVDSRPWFTATGSPVWVPFTSTWTKDPSLEVALGVDPAEAARRAAEAEAKAEAEAEADEESETTQSAPKPATQTPAPKPPPAEADEKPVEAEATGTTSAGGDEAAP